MSRDVRLSVIDYIRTKPSVSNGVICIVNGSKASFFFPLDFKLSPCFESKCMYSSKKNETTTQYTIKRPRLNTLLLYLLPPHLLTHSDPPTTCCPLPIGPAPSSKPRPCINTTSAPQQPYFIPHIQPLKMELIECSETSAYCNFNQTLGKYPKEYIHLDSKHGKSLKSSKKGC